MRRRELIAALGGAIVASVRLASGQTRVPHLVYLWLGPAGSDGSTREGLQTGLRELGYREGQDIVVQYSYADGKEERLAELAAAAVAGQPNVIVAPGTVVTRAVKRLTSTIPVVSVSGDPVGSGFITSLARPGGNITGFTIRVGPELAGKWLELILEIAPRARRVAWLTNALNPVSSAELVAMRAAAHSLGGNVTLDEYPIREAADLPSALEAIRRAKPDALVVDNDPLIISNRAAVVASSAGLPGICGARDFVDAGGLVSYGASIFDIYRRAASYIDRILKGAKPAGLPVEQPTKFELVINLKTAEALGLTVPPLLLAEAAEVIE